MVLEFVVGVVLRKEWKLMRRRAKCKWWLDFSTKWYSKKPYTPFPQSYELGCFSSMFVVVVVVCLFVYLFDCLSVFMSGWLVGWFFLFIFLFVWLFCMFVWMFDCLFALQWGRFHHPFCNFCKSQTTVQNLEFVGGLLDGGIGVWIELSVLQESLVLFNFGTHIFSIHFVSSGYADCSTWKVRGPNSTATTASFTPCGWVGGDKDANFCVIVVVGLSLVV